MESQSLSEVLEPSSDFIDHFIPGSIQSSHPFVLNDPEHSIKLDQNESSADWPLSLKKKICDELTKLQWNRYPEPYPKSLRLQVAKHAGVHPKNVLLGPGSNTLIAELMHALLPSLRPDQCHFAVPSFPLFMSHAKQFGFTPTPWLPNKDFVHSINDLHVTPGSLVVFASPNNPTGTTIPKKDLEKFLLENPESLVLADEAYKEFCDEDYTSLLSKFSNLVILRTFSKTFGAAGLRLGYLLGSEALLREIHKTQLPFRINLFTSTALSLALSDSEFQSLIQSQKNHVKAERARIFEAFSQVKNIKIFPSEANFFLVKDFTKGTFGKHLLNHAKILARDISKQPLLEDCLRISIGTKEENTKLIETSLLFK